jgi:MATE family multidrug resistance protein
VLAIVPLVFSEQIVAIFLEPDDPALPAIMETAASLFIISAFLGVFDGLQAVASRALRGLRDTLIPMWIAAVGYWLVGIGGGVLLAFEFGFGPSGLWMGLAGGLMVTGVILTWRFIKRTRPPMHDLAESETQAK